jgi:hypothetical protein
MSNYQSNPNNCLLFKHEKAGNERMPDYVGDIEIEGTGQFQVAL